MIVFLTIIYIAILLLLVWLKIVPWNIYWKLSPAIWMFLLFVVLFIPMNWGAPSGPVLVIRESVAIVPNVAGEVTEVPVQANVPLKTGDILFKIDPEPYDAQVRQIEAELKLAQLNMERAATLEQKQTATLATLQQRQAEVAQLRAKLGAAKWNLDKTIVRAPSDGFVKNVGLRPGARVAAFPISPVLAFIETGKTIVGVEVQQIYARHIAAGQPVEIAFKFLPGIICRGRVVAFLQATAQGQQRASGTAVQPINIQSAPFVVRIELEDKSLAASLPAGATGEAAIYTDSAQLTHVIRRVMIRMTTYKNFVIPF